jgi:excisionase family DNA binding protein
MQSFYTTFEASKLLSVSLPTVVNWIKARRLKAHRTPGGHRRIARGDLAAFMVRHGMPLPPELSGAVPGRRKALVVGVAGPAREGLVRQLVAAGYAAEQASPGFAAGAAAARFGPDVLVVQPDGPDGGDAVRGPRGDRELAELPVVAVAPADWQERLADAGCVAVVVAPPRDGALAAELERILEGPASRPGHHPSARPAGVKKSGRRRREAGRTPD